MCVLGDSLRSREPGPEQGRAHRRDQKLSGDASMPWLLPELLNVA